MSNDGFYKQLHRKNKLSVDSARLFDSLLGEGEQRNRTKPYKFRIVKNELSFRELSLINPHSQLQVALFYKKYADLICYHCNKSNFSMRLPERIGSAYYVPSEHSDVNKYKISSVDDTEIDRLARNPASFFAYRGFQKLHKFFSSSSYIQLEKRFAYSASLDVHRCFDSIYTHSVSWAIKGKSLAKDQSSQTTFGGEFDKLMQRLNWDETNGICIGPEVSRIFAEVIFSEIDRRIEEKLRELGYEARQHYDCRRYVDNYYFFSDSEETLAEAQRSLSSELKRFNLHINEEKTEITRRPFYTKKSQAISQINAHLGEFFEKLISNEHKSTAGKTLSAPRFIYRHRSLFNNLINKVKDSCFSANVGYDCVANYILGALRLRTLSLVDSYLEIDPEERPDEETYERCLLLLLDLSFYFLSLHPTVPSSLRVCHSIVRISRFIESEQLSFSAHFEECLLRWVNQLIQTPVFSKLFSRHEVIPVELWNVILCLAETTLPTEAIRSVIDRVERRSTHGTYFRIVSELFIYKDLSDFDEQKATAVNSARHFLSSCRDIPRSSEHLHLFLDLLSCPYISEDLKETILSENWESLDGGNGRLPARAHASPRRIVEELGAENWFVCWTGIDLLRLIEKRELSRVYA